MALHQQQQDGLTSTTAPGKVFVSRSELAQHYKSDWHKYNLKRREAGLPLLNEENFQARLQAALALKKEQEEREKRDGTDHLKHKNNKKKGNKNNKKSKGQKLGGGGGNGVDGDVVAVSQAAAYDKIKNKNSSQEEEEGEEEKKQIETDRTIEDDGTGTMQIDGNTEKDEETSEGKEEEEELPIIEPRQCLFDRHMSANIECNVDRMARKYGFFIPDEEYLIDLEGFLGYCQEKIKLGHCCLYCQKLFTTYHGCQKHMISKRHTKIRYEIGIDMDEFDPFYDFTEADEEFLGSAMTRNNTTNTDESYAVLDGDEDNDDKDDGEWEDVSDDEEDEMDVDVTDTTEEEEDEGLYAGYEDEIAKYGYDITPLGELIFPDGRIIGHRGLKRYYKQRIPTRNNDSTAVVAARRAAGERLYRGRVYNMYNNNNIDDNGNSNETALALSRAGINPDSAGGRAGNGILVRSGGVSFTALSLYRYRAVAKKARRDDARGKRLENKVRRPINKMDKKANRLYNNVSVAHAKR